MDLAKLNIPNNWSKVTVEQFIQLKSMEFEDFHTLLSFKMDQLFILTDTTEDDKIWEEINSQDLDKLFKQIQFLNIQPTINYKKEINLNGIVYTCKEINKLTVGEFIDLERYFTNNYLTNLPNICAILYRRTQINSWEHIEFEPRKYNEADRAELFLEAKITEVYGVIQTYLNFKQNFITTYENMLSEPDTNEELETPTVGMTKEELEELRREKMLSKWGWAKAVYQFGQDSNLSFNEVTELPLIYFFNTLAMKKDLNL